jgi:hypothetical protein
MSKRIIISVAAAALIAVPAQSASAAISKPVGPVEQEMEHGVVQPSFESGYGTSPGISSPDAIEPEATESEATESISSEGEQGVSTSPGATDPATEPSGPEATEKTEGHATGASEEECKQRAADIDGYLGLAAESWKAGDYMYAVEWAVSAVDTKIQGEKRGCVFTNSEEGESAE